MHKFSFIFFLSLFFVIPFFFPVHSFSQTPGQWAKLGDEATADGDFFGAALYYKNALSYDSASRKLTFRYAESLRKSNDYAMAEYYYAKLNKTEVSASDKESFPEALFWLATMQKFNGDYENAKENFRKFEKTYKNKSSYYAKKARQEVKSCEFAKRMIPGGDGVTIKNAGGLLNSSDSELSAVLKDDSSLYFSSLHLPGPGNSITGKELKSGDSRMKLFKAKKDSSGWKTDAELDSAINNPSFHTANGTFSRDKKRFYFSRCTESFKCAIFMSEFANGKWQAGVRLENGINTDSYTSTQPMLAEIDGEEILFYVSDMPGGKGRLDIWTINITEINKGKANVRPKNLSKINTMDNDITPFFDSDNHILYFSSEWYYGLGGMDIFKSRLNGKNFSIPENTGAPFNTSVNDLYFSFYPEINGGFLTSNRKGSFSKAGETCCNDIYEFHFPEKAKKDSLVIEEKEYSSLDMLNKYLPVTLYFHNDEPNPRSRDTLTSLNYLETYNDYLAMMDNYKEKHSEGMTGENSEKAKNNMERFFSDYAEKGINDLELFSELLLRELEKGEKIELVVKGYASPLAKTDYNVNLTLRRISSLENYLKEAMDGAYLPYLEKTSSSGGSLEIVKIPFGEYKADVAVSDNLDDQRNSVYSPQAALERKIEIISVTRANKDSAYAEITFEEEIHDFGTVERGEKLSHIFNFKNNGNENLLVKNITSSCGCTVAKWTRNELVPGGKGEIEVTFDTVGKSGKQVKTVTIETNAVPSTRVIHVTAEVLGE